MPVAGQFRILLVDDNDTDVLLLKQSLAAQQPCDFTVIGNGERAWEFLERRGPYAGAPRPDLVVLDLNLPGKNGVDLIKGIRGSAELHHLTVAVVSSWPSEISKEQAAEADCWVRKPSDLDEFLAIGREILNCYTSK